jgi:hypothetical protein
MTEREALVKGLMQAEGEVILFINADCYAPKEWVSSHLRHYPGVSAVVGAPGTSLKRLAFRNASIERWALDEAGLEDIPTHLDMDIGMKLEKMGIRYALAPEITVFHDDEEGILKQFSYGFNAGLAIKRNKPGFRSKELSYLGNPIRSLGIIYGLIYPASGAFSFVHNRRKD